MDVDARRSTVAPRSPSTQVVFGDVVQEPFRFVLPSARRAPMDEAEALTSSVLVAPPPLPPDGGLATINRGDVSEPRGFVFSGADLADDRASSTSESLARRFSFSPPESDEQAFRSPYFAALDSLSSPPRAMDLDCSHPHLAVARSRIRLHLRLHSLHRHRSLCRPLRFLDCSLKR